MRPRARAATGLLVVTLLGSAVSACTGVGGPLGPASGGTADGAPRATPVDSPPSDAAVEVQQAVTALVVARAAAVTAHDRGAWLASLADPGDGFGSAQAAQFDRLVQLPVTGPTVRSMVVAPSAPSASPSAAGIPGTPGAPVTAATWVANLQLAYRFEGYDQGDRTYSASYLVTHTDAGWRLADVGPGRTDIQAFDLPGLASVRSPSTLVLGDVPAATLQSYLELGDAGRTHVEQAWGSARPSVIVAPKTVDELRAQLGRASFPGLEQVAAITDGPLASGRPAQSDRMFLNPEAFAKLSATGRSVVVTHELTHVTVRGSTTRPVPLWLSEGYADAVAFSTTDLPTTTVAADLLTQVRAGKGPTGLPTAADFDPAKGPISPIYNAVWLAVVRIRDTYGADRLRELYRAVSGGPTADPAVTGSADDLTAQAFRSVLRVDEDAFVTDWKAYLASLAR